MVVDDEKAVGYSVEQGLKYLNAPYRIFFADSGEKCIDYLKKHKNLPDLILLDIMMPGMSGWEVYDKIKENKNWSRIPIVFLTARSDPIAKNAGYSLAEDYIQKPFDLNDLKKRLDIFLNQ